MIPIPSSCESPPLARLTPEFDIETLRFDGERRWRRRIDAAPIEWRTTVDSCHVDLASGATPIDRDAIGVKASAHSFSALYRFAQTLRGVLRLDADLELFPFASGRFVVEPLSGPRPGPIRVAVSAPVVERLSLREALFVVGRRVGSVLLDHGTAPTAALGGVANPVSARREWRRFQELSSDRVGLLCCQDFAVAARALLKSTSGLPREQVDIDLEALLRRSFDPARMMRGDDPHEFMLLRFAALKRFFGSERYRAAFRAAPDATETVEGPDRAGSEAGASHVALLVEEKEEIDDAVAAARVAPTEDASHSASDQNGDSAARPHSGLPADQAVAPNQERQFHDQGPDPDSDEFVALRRRFLLHAAYWIVQRADVEAGPGPAPMVEAFGPDWREDLDPDCRDEDAEVAQRVCHRLAPAFVGSDLDLRLAIVEELFYLAISEGMANPWNDGRVIEIAEMLALARDQLAILATEYVDPEFADYRFSAGERVDVWLDGEWVTGSVRQIETSGDLRIHFPDEGETLRLSPTADLIRPTSLGRAG